ncbi:MAG: signal peptidase I [Bacteriovoracaceae bacterium]
MFLMLKNFLLKNCLLISLISNPEKLTVRGHSMEPLLKEGQEIYLLKDYYKNNKAEKGDVVVLVVGLEKNKIIKKVFGISGDKFSVVNSGSNCSIQINGEILKNSFGTVFYLNCKILELYARDYSSIPKDGYLILGEMTDGSNDSSKFGLVGREQILGKVCF